MNKGLILALLSLLAFLGSCSELSKLWVASPAGSYQLDTTEMEAQLKSEMPEFLVPTLLKALADSELKLKEDNTFEMKFSTMGSDTTETGTWRVEGKKITLTSSRLNGSPHSEEKVGTFKSGVISIDMDVGGTSRTLVLRKK